MYLSPNLAHYVYEIHTFLRLLATSRYLCLFRCLVPECESSPPQWAPGEWGQWALPGGDLSSCERNIPVDNSCKEDSFLNSTQSCTDWLYETNNTIVAEVSLLTLQFKQQSFILNFTFNLYLIRTPDLVRTGMPGVETHSGRLHSQRRPLYCTHIHRIHIRHVSSVLALLSFIGIYCGQRV